MSRQAILPGATIGMLGSGQLGRMSAIEARKMGYRIITLSPGEGSPTGQVADAEVVAPLDDVEAAVRLAQQCDVVTYEFENVDLDLADAVAGICPLRPGSSLLELAQHRVREKQGIEAIDLPVTPFWPVTTRADLRTALDKRGLPGILKTATGGYDGKGQRLVSDLAQAAAAYEELLAQSPQLVYESLVSFDQELSVIASRGLDGTVKTFPPAENIHRDGILHVSIVPARAPQAVLDAAAELAANLVRRLDVVGVVGIELFRTGNQLLVNEIAPRPHNSGHYSFDACQTSQFEQHIRAVCGLPLGNPQLISPVVMVNILGQHLPKVVDHTAGLLSIEGLKLHLYGKDEARTGRKMGHLCVMADTVSTALDRAKQAWSTFGADRPLL